MILGACPVDYYWSVDQSEWATDVLFRSRRELADRYGRWLLHGVTSLGSRDVLRFLGRRTPGQGNLYGALSAEVQTSLREREEGVRLKHFVNLNSIKMYDKQGSVLRIETTLNSPRQMKVYRPKEGDENGPKAWRYLRKGVADMHRRAEVSQAANERYLDSLAAVDDATPLEELVAPLCRPVFWNGQRVRALNPLAGPDAALLAAAAQGEFLVHGFRNRDLQGLLYGGKPPRPPTAAAARPPSLGGSACFALTISSRKSRAVIATNSRTTGEPSSQPSTLRDKPIPNNYLRPRKIFANEEESDG